MEHPRIGEAANPATIGRRKVRRRVCIADRKRHIRVFLSGALEELGFSACECAQVGQLDLVLEEQLPDLVIVGLSADGVEAGEILETLAAREFDGKVLLLGPRDSLALSEVEELGIRSALQCYPRSLRLSALGPCVTASPRCFRTNSPPNPVRPPKRQAGAGSNCGTSRKSTCPHWLCAAPRRSSASVTRLGAPSRQLISFQMMAIPTCVHSQSLSSAERSMIGAISLIDTITSRT